MELILGAWIPLIAGWVVGVLSVRKFSRMNRNVFLNMLAGFLTCAVATAVLSYLGAWVLVTSTGNKDMLMWFGITGMFVNIASSAIFMIFSIFIRRR